ncbi:MAG: DUF5074 domain-containing protein [Flavobacteriales bacterium]
MKRIIAGFAIATMALASCGKETPAPGTTNYSHGRFITNEGNFGSSNATITYIADDGTVINDVYFLENNLELGDVLQSFTVIGDKGYAVLNNSQKVVVVTIADMKHAATITGLDYPRYVLDGGNGKAYLTDGAMNGYVRVIDLATNSIAESIAVGNGPEKMILDGNLLYVCNSGGWNIDNTVSVIDITTNTLVQTIAVSDRPQDIVHSSDGDVWVLCSGETLYDVDWNIVGHTDAKIFRINSDTYLVEDEQSIGANGDHPRQLEVSPDGGMLYFENNGVFQFSIAEADFDATEIIADMRGSLNIHPGNGELWCVGISDFVTASVVYRYSAGGTLVASYTAGIGANGVAFN